jgi:3-deoxy-D-manno-octulosonate 8-phosphate phosphatase (KDO 8-P phosphatase)
MGDCISQNRRVLQAFSCAGWSRAQAAAAGGHCSGGHHRAGFQAPLRKRLEALGIEHVHFGTLKTNCPWPSKRWPSSGCNGHNAAAMGDDWPDLPVMQACHFACAPANAHVEVQALAHYVTRARGGEGAAREFCDVLLVASGQYAALLEGYKA